MTEARQERAEREAQQAELARLTANAEPIDRVERGELTEDDVGDRRHEGARDEYTVLVPEGWVIEVDMTSEAFDTYVWLSEGGRRLAQDDDG